jgi:hypothetical protein
VAPGSVATASGFNISAFNLGVSAGSFVGARLLAGPGLAAEGKPVTPGQRAPHAALEGVQLAHKRVQTNGVMLHYVTAGRGPVVLCMYGWPQNHREFLPVIGRLADRYTFIAPDLRGYADCDKPFDGYEPKTITQDMLGLLEGESSRASTS